MKSFKGSGSGPVVGYSVTVNVNPPSVAANTGVYADFTIPANPGCQVGQRVFLNPDADFSTPGLSLGDPRVSAANTVRAQYLNVTTGALDAAAIDINFVFIGQP